MSESGTVQQLVLFREPAQKRKRGGKRRGAGRPPKGTRAGERHKRRPFHKVCNPVHIVLRVVKAIGSLRRRRTYQAIRLATRTVARREGFRIVHISIQRTHVHLLVEATRKTALASGMQGFQISAAKHLNAAISVGRPGPPPSRPGVSGPLSRGGDRFAPASATRLVVRDQQLAKAPRRSR